MQKKKIFEKKGAKPTARERAPEKLTGNEREGIIIAHFGATVDVQDSDQGIVRCHLRKNSEPCITGDRVLWRNEQDKSHVVVTVLPRKSLLARPESSSRNKMIAANIDAIIIVTAPPPILSFKLLDRYLVAAENLAIQPIILLNKIDLLKSDELKNIKDSLSLYEKIGYQVVYSSVRLTDGLQALKTILRDKCSVLVGVSGVGKSSIISALTQHKDITVGDVSATTGLGKHTTTATRLYSLPEGGSLIDSPGVREFALWHLSPSDVMRGFIDFQPFIGECKFRNCQHQTEPGCALQAAVEQKKIAELRWQSYWDIVSDQGR